MEQAESSKGGDDYVIILRDNQSNVAAIPVADLPAVDISTADKVSTPSDTAEDKNKSKDLPDDHDSSKEPPAANSKGQLFVEARMTEIIFESWRMEKEPEEFLRELLETQLNLPDLTFELHEDILYESGELTGTCRLGKFYEQLQRALVSLRVVEYVGVETEERCYSSNNVVVRVHVYLMDHVGAQKYDEELPGAEIFNLPNIRFDGLWESLIYEEEGRDVKADLLWATTNLIHLSPNSHSRGWRRKTARSILLHGPPGTGKTSLCQALSQKISIRLQNDFTYTLLVQIDTASLLSKYFSESAQQVNRIFSTIQKWCEEMPRRYICVLIDEAEGIATTRTIVSQGGDCQDALRATNALLTSMDRTKHLPNLVFLYTSNMLQILDAAFIDRCEALIPIEPASIKAQYEILRTELQNMIDGKCIKSQEILCSFDIAEIKALISPECPASKLLGLVQSIGAIGISGRLLNSIPESAFLQCSRGGKRDLNSVLLSMERFLVSARSTRKRKAETEAKREGMEDLLVGQKKVKILMKGRDLEFSQSIVLPIGGEVTVDLPILPAGGIVTVEVMQ